MKSTHRRFWPIGTFVNMTTVILGSSIGLVLQKTFPENIQSIVFQAIGLSTLLIGVKMALKVEGNYLLVVIFSMILGGAFGELIELKVMLTQLSEHVKAIFHIQDNLFTEGLITSFLLFCVGSMTIVGAIEEGLEGKRELLYIKSTLDGVSSIAFASTYGVGVLFSIFPMLIFQGGLTILANKLQHLFTVNIINQLNGVGGLLIIGIGINLLHLGTINIENLLPALIVVVGITWFYDRLK